MSAVNKVMATIFWDVRGVIYFNYLQKGGEIKGELVSIRYGVT